MVTGPAIVQSVGRRRQIDVHSHIGGAATGNAWGAERQGGIAPAAQFVTHAAASELALECGCCLAGRERERRGSRRRRTRRTAVDRCLRSGLVTRKNFNARIRDSVAVFRGRGGRYYDVRAVVDADLVVSCLRAVVSGRLDPDCAEAREVDVRALLAVERVGAEGQVERVVAPAGVQFVDARAAVQRVAPRQLSSPSPPSSRRAAGLLTASTPPSASATNSITSSPECSDDLVQHDRQLPNAEEVVFGRAVEQGAVEAGAADQSVHPGTGDELVTIVAAVQFVFAVVRCQKIPPRAARRARCHRRRR